MGKSLRPLGRELVAVTGTLRALTASKQRKAVSFWWGPTAFHETTRDLKGPLGMSEGSANSHAGGAASASGVSEAATILEARSVRKSYGTGEKSLPVLTDANLNLRSGEMVAIVAPSGAGK